MLEFRIKSFAKIANGYRIFALQRCQTFSTTHLSHPAQVEENEQTSWDKAKPYDSIPGPSIFQLITRNLPSGRYHGLEWSELNKRIRDEYGSIAKLPAVFGHPETVVISDASDFEIVFRNEGTWPNRRGLNIFNHYRKDLRSNMFKGMGGLGSDQGEPWGKLRSAVNPILLKPATVNAYIPVVDDITMEFIDQIKASRDQNNELPANFLYDLNTWAMESISFISLDCRLNVVGTNKDKDAKALNLIKAVDQLFTLAVDLELKPSIWRYVRTPTYNKLIATLDCITETTFYYIKQAIERSENERKNPKSDEQHRVKTVFEKLLSIDEHVAIVMAIDMMTAGVDTTASATANFLYHLAKNPNKQEKLRQELKAVPLDADGKLKPSSFGKVPYLRACLKEAVRLSPIIPGNTRAIARDVVLKDYQVPQGTNVMMANASSYHEEKEFKNPNEFIPERWLSEKMPDACLASKASNPFVYLPFGFGPRACIGKRIAEMEMSVLATRLFTQFQLEFNYGPLKYRNGIVLSPITPLKFKLTEL